jgi:hypothetical protein
MCPETESLEGLGNSSKATRCNSRAGLCLLLSDHKIGTVGECPRRDDSAMVMPSIPEAYRVGTTRSRHREVGAENGDGFSCSVRTDDR